MLDSLIIKLQRW